ncbi:hypothetical protein EVAR_5245_1 [Eumeta japonica]|uniref:Uncharacterized protein n=1 Tax=Eumeta variegata TaxID=151549 RepID=A0A4C1XSD4_EUMVA|nr:hypothetical protein EVAR_5245_1 [Eumeta japonica]
MSRLAGFPEGPLFEQKYLLGLLFTENLTQYVGPRATKPYLLFASNMQLQQNLLLVRAIRIHKGGDTMNRQKLSTECVSRDLPEAASTNSKDRPRPDRRRRRSANDKCGIRAV